MLLSSTAATVLLIFGTVLIIVGLVGKAMAAGGVNIAAPETPGKRALMVIAGVAVFLLAAVNPVVRRFTVSEAKIDAIPSAYHGPCPVGIELVGIVRAKNGSGKVTSNLFIASVLGAGVREIRMENGDTVQRTVVVQKSVTTRAWYVVLAPDKAESSRPLKVVCTKARR